ncbi:MAG: PLD nuclease N-terminal domain-containing protein [Candidatus Peribacteraceae bacterium]|nr:PLD nuclease N-terminal domain-containing protein [Candidatus Peribacteraceae bacterium]MDD5074254.1 PLD nuclease N-terminal domain-containing protein [Candidatus Peribacteraceae bacterium]
MQILATLRSLLDPLLLFLSDDPVLRVLQVVLIMTGALVIFFVFYTTRDILRRTHSFLYMAFCIVIVAALPVFGFLLYLLIRPSRTLLERENDRILREFHDEHLRRKHDGSPRGQKKVRKQDEPSLL